MAVINYEDAVAITDDIYWVGFHDQDTNLHCNPYLFIDDQDVADLAIAGEILNLFEQGAEEC